MPTQFLQISCFLIQIASQIAHEENNFKTGARTGITEIHIPSYCVMEEFLGHISQDERTIQNIAQRYKIDFCFDLLDLATHFEAVATVKIYIWLCLDKVNSSNVISALERSLDSKHENLTYGMFQYLVLHVCEIDIELKSTKGGKKFARTMEKLFNSIIYSQDLT